MLDQLSRNWNSNTRDMELEQKKKSVEQMRHRLDTIRPKKKGKRREAMSLKIESDGGRLVSPVPVSKRVSCKRENSLNFYKNKIKAVIIGKKKDVRKKKRRKERIEGRKAEELERGLNRSKS